MTGDRGYSCTSPDSSVLFRKGRFDGQKFEDSVVFYEESSNVHKAQQIVEAGFICRACVLVHDSDHPTDLDRLGKLLDCGLQYIATNEIGSIIGFDPYRHATEKILLQAQRDSNANPSVNKHIDVVMSTSNS